ncbi:Chorismate mutase 2 [Bienertia sinuspersici]
MPASAAAVSVNNNNWDFYIHQYLQLLDSKGEDGNYALSVSSDLALNHHTRLWTRSQGCSDTIL